MKDKKFQTDSNPFQKEYAENAILQKGFNQQIIADLAQYILRQFPWATSKPISILDLCCGDGGTTNDLLKELKSLGIQVKKIVGIDNAPEQIKRAKFYSENNSQLEFDIQNVEKINYVEQFDVVVSLFGLHWIEDLEKMAEKISLALKSNGITVFFVPLEKNDLFALRQQLMSTANWKESFKDFVIHPFIDDASKYFSSFCKYFNPENKNGIRGDQPVYFTEEKFIRFLSSWMQEVRYLQNKNKSDDYLKNLITNISPTNEPTADVTTLNVEGEMKIRFLEKFFWYHATKKNVDNKNEIELSPITNKI